MKSLPLLLAVGLSASQSALAQTQPTPPTTRIAVTRRRIGSDTPPAQLAEEETARLTGQLSLSPAQATQVQAAALKRTQAHQAELRKYEAMHYVGMVPPAEGQAIEADFEAQLKAICTPKQYARRQRMQARLRRISAENDSLLQVKYDKEGGPK